MNSPSKKTKGANRLYCRNKTKVLLVFLQIGNIMDAVKELEKIREWKRIASQKGEFARRKSKLDNYRTHIFDLYNEGASLSEIKRYILIHLTNEDKEKGFKLHRTTIQKYIKRFTHG